jgi:hypothetical protein
MTMSSTESSVILKGPNDWDAWNRQFRAEAKGKRLCEQIEGTVPFRTLPQEPNLSIFLPQAQTQAQTQVHSQVQTRSSRSATVDVPATHIPTPAELTADGRSNYQLAYTVYKDQRDQYDKQQDALDKLQSWMTKTVAPSYAHTCFNPEQDIKIWYNNLKEQVGVNDFTIITDI